MSANEAARALGQGDPLGALNMIARDPSALGLLLRGIAYAQLGDFTLAARTLASAAGADDALVAARARAALVELSLRTGAPETAAQQAREAMAALLALGDLRNAALQKLTLARAEVLLGRLGEARHTLEGVLAEAPLDLRPLAWLARAEVAIRSVAASAAAAALQQARQTDNPLLLREVAALERELVLPIARIKQAEHLRDADLFAIERVSDGTLLLVDACRLLVIAGRATVPLARRPVLFALLARLARAWPQPVARDVLAQHAFDVKRVNDSHRARLRVEIGRLRKAIGDLGARPEATREGYALRATREVALLLPSSDDSGAHVAMLLGDGAAWTAQALAEHAGVSRRTAQRVLGALVERGNAVRIGVGRDVRYVRPGTPLASRMLLLGLLPKP